MVVLLDQSIRQNAEARGCLRTVQERRNGAERASHLLRSLISARTTARTRNGSCVAGSSPSDSLATLQPEQKRLSCRSVSFSLILSVSLQPKEHRIPTSTKGFIRIVPTNVRTEKALFCGDTKRNATTSLH